MPGVLGALRRAPNEWLQLVQPAAGTCKAVLPGGTVSSDYLPSLRGTTTLAGRLPRGIARLTDDEMFDGAIRAARVQAAGAVTLEALEQLARLVESEEELRRMHPLATRRAEMLINQFAMVAGAEIADMGRR